MGNSTIFILLHVCVCVCVYTSTHSVPFDCATPWTMARQNPLSIEFSRQGYWSELPFPTPGNPPNPGIELASLVSSTLAGGFFTTVYSNLI